MNMYRSCLSPSSLRRLIAESRRTITKTPVNADKIGFIGLGNMGSAMAENLLKAGHQLVVYDVKAQAMEPFVAQGAIGASCPSQVASQVSRLLTMLPGPRQVLDVYLGPDGLLSGRQPTKGAILIDSSTVDPSTSQQVGVAAEAAGVAFLDAPVSGAVPAARSGTLTFMVGGPSETVQQIRPLLLSLGSNVVHTGSVGTGVTAKLCNNMMGAISMLATAETLLLGESLGLDPAMLTSILNVSSGRTWVSEKYPPVPGLGDDHLPCNGDYSGGFASALLAKDLNLAQSIAVGSQSPTPMGALALQIYQLLVNQGEGPKDFSYVYQFLKQTVSRKEYILTTE